MSSRDRTTSAPVVHASARALNSTSYLAKGNGTLASVCRALFPTSREIYNGFGSKTLLDGNLRSESPSLPRIFQFGLLRLAPVVTSALEFSLCQTRRFLSKGYECFSEVAKINRKSIRDPDYYIPLLRKSKLLSTHLKTFQRTFATLRAPFTLPTNLKEKFYSSHNIEIVVEDWDHKCAGGVKIPSPASSTSSASETSSSSSEEGLDFYHPTIPISTSPEANLRVFIPLQSRSIMELEDEEELEVEEVHVEPMSSSWSTLLNSGTIQKLQSLDQAYEERRAKVEFLESIGNLMKRREVFVGGNLIGWTYDYQSSNKDEDYRLISQVLGEEMKVVAGEREAVEGVKEGFFTIFS